LINLDRLAKIPPLKQGAAYTMLKLQDDRTSLKMLFVFILIAYLFSVGMRFIWVNEVSSIPQFHWNNELMINTNDGYAFAEGARDILKGHHEENDLSWSYSAISQLTAFLAKVLPISFETLILYMPTFIGSLIVIPLILIGRALNQTSMGFIAALIGSIAHSYYNRTMTGYYDTDMLNIVFPVLEMYSLILALTHQRNRTLIPITISIALYQWWYPGAYALDSALFLMVVGYALIFERKNVYLYKIALFILIGILAIPLVSKISLALIVFAFFHFQKELSTKLFWPLFASVVALYFFTGGIDPIWVLLKVYVVHNTANNTVATGLNYYNVISTVREAGQIPFTIFAERISGHTITFIAACIGYVMAIIAYRPLLITLPLAGLGFIAMAYGLRFTIYAVPVMAIGLAYLIVYLSNFIQITLLRYIIAALLTLAVLTPNYLHIKEYIMPTVMTSEEVDALDRLGKISSAEDYVVGWWDYGYPIRYYSDVKTWIDGAKHTGDANYPASYVLSTKDQLSAANMMRFYTEYTENGFKDTNKTTNDFETMMSKEGYKEPDDFLNALSLPETVRPAKTRDVYLYLPLRMLEIFPTVALFSNLDLKNPDNRQQPFFYATQQIQDTGKTIELGNGISILKEKNTLNLGNQEVPIKAFYQVGYTQDKTLQVNEQNFSSEGLSVIYMASYNRFLVVDDFYLDSTYIQMFVFERYNKNLFEPVILDPMTKIYKLKI
jgi:dolichyl-diphosphooligosaccharide--protein glycosyltransferase/undecaprenyl-diphosphooligosaccharide--protein glycosyltransferase